MFTWSAKSPSRRIDTQIAVAVACACGIPRIHVTNGGCSRTDWSPCLASRGFTSYAKRIGARPGEIGQGRKPPMAPHGDCLPEVGAMNSELTESAVVLALIAATPGVLALGWQCASWALGGRRARLDRQRERFAEAFAAIVAYAEFPYVVRRRRASAPEDERLRISGELRAVQERIAFSTAWLHSESPRVARAYGALVEQLRRVAGAQIAEGWTTPPIKTDEGMNIRSSLGLEALDPLKLAYLDAVIDHLHTFGWARRWFRIVRRWIDRTKMNAE